MSADEVTDDDKFWVIKFPKLKTKWSYKDETFEGNDFEEKIKEFEDKIEGLTAELKNMWRECQPTKGKKVLKALHYEDPGPLIEFTKKLESLKDASQKLGQFSEAEKITDDAWELNRKAARFMQQLHQDMSDQNGRLFESSHNIRGTQTQTTAQAQSRDKNLFV